MHKPQSQSISQRETKLRSERVYDFSSYPIVGFHSVFSFLYETYACLLRFGPFSISFCPFFVAMIGIPLPVVFFVLYSPLVIF
jgi:hypothetical protein